MLRVLPEKDQSGHQATGLSFWNNAKNDLTVWIFLTNNSGASVQLLHPLAEGLRYTSFANTAEVEAKGAECGVRGAQGLQGLHGTRSMPGMA